LKKVINSLTQMKIGKEALTVVY